MRLFVAAPWPRRDAARIAAKVFEAHGQEIVRPWWDTEDTGDKDYKAHALADLAGVADADALVALVHPDLGVGMWVEVGAALAEGKPVYMVDIDDVESLPPNRSIYDTLGVRLSFAGLLEVFDDKRREAEQGA